MIKPGVTGVFVTTIGRDTLEETDTRDDKGRQRDHMTGLSRRKARTSQVENRLGKLG